MRDGGEKRESRLSVAEGSGRSGHRMPCKLAARCEVKISEKTRSESKFLALLLVALEF